MGQKTELVQLEAAEKKEKGKIFISCYEFVSGAQLSSQPAQLVKEAQPSIIKETLFILLNYVY